MHRRPAVLLEPKVSTRWVRETAASYGGEKADDSILIDIVSRIRQPAVFATLDLDDRHVAWGLGVAERGYVGLYDIVVVPELRGIGLGRRVVTSLMAWGRDEGAHSAYLQVREDNEVARSLYEGARLRAAPTATPTGSCQSAPRPEGRDERAGDDERAGERERARRLRVAGGTRIRVDSTGAA